MYTVYFTNQHEKISGPSQTSRIVIWMTRFGWCANTTRKRERLVTFPIPIVRNSQRIEDMFLRKPPDIITVNKKLPRNINKKIISNSQFLLYILSNVASLKDPTCARSRQNSFQSRASSIIVYWRNEATLSCMRRELAIL